MCYKIGSVASVANVVPLVVESTCVTVLLLNFTLYCMNFKFIFKKKRKVFMDFYLVQLIKMDFKKNGTKIFRG